MILLCVGSVNPFNRLVRTVDTWAKSNLSVPITAQIGTATYQPQNMEHMDFFATDMMQLEAYDNADILIGDLSVEVLLPAVVRGLPVLCLPRLSIFGEEMGVEQANLANHLKSDDFIQVAHDENQLFELLSLPRTPFKISQNSTHAQEKSDLFQARLIKAQQEVG